MTNDQRHLAITEAAAFADRDAYISDVARSSVWGDADAATIPQERIEALGAIWDAAHRSIKDIAALAGTSVRQIGLRYGIPRRTIENWSVGISDPPTWTLLLLQQALGLLKHDTRRE